MKPGDLAKTTGTWGWGDIVLILRTQGDQHGTRWFVLRTDGTTGWISHNFLKVLP